MTKLQIYQFPNQPQIPLSPHLNPNPFVGALEPDFSFSFSPFCFSPTISSPTLARVGPHLAGDLHQTAPLPTTHLLQHRQPNPTGSSATNSPPFTPFCSPASPSSTSRLYHAVITENEGAPPAVTTPTSSVARTRRQDPSGVDPLRCWSSLPGTACFSPSSLLPIPASATADRQWRPPDLEARRLP